MTSTPSKPHFSLLATSFPGGPRPRTTAIILFGLWIVLFFAALFTPPVLDDADGTHAQAAQAMATTGDLVTLRVDGVRYLEKAPLPYWLAALCFRIFGFNAFAAHLPQALAVLLLALLGYRWANQAFGARTAFYTAISVLTSSGVFLFTRVLIPEVLLSLCLAASLFAFLKSVSRLSHAEPRTAKGTAQADGSIVPERPSIAWYAGPWFYPMTMWGSLALAVLAKGLVALVFFFATCILFLLLTGDIRHWRKLKPFSGLLLFLAIAAPWHVLAALANPGGPAAGVNGHGFLWFYFVNEHVLRFLGRRIPADYNKLPGYLYWTLHLVWLFPWSLFLPLGLAALWHRYRHQVLVLTAHLKTGVLTLVLFVAALVAVATRLKHDFKMDWTEYMLLVLAMAIAFGVPLRRKLAGLEPSPFHRIDPQQRTILLLALFSAIVLLFFSLSTNQEYYTFPAYMPILLLIAATVTRAEQTFSSDAWSRRAIRWTHASFTIIGVLVAVALFYGLWASRHVPRVEDIGTLLAHRGVGSYTLSMSSLFDLTLEAFAALRLPALLAALAFTFGPALAWQLRVQRRHLASTTAIAFTAALFVFAAHLALGRFAPMLSSADFAERIQMLEAVRKIAPDTQFALFGDQAYGSSLAFYLDKPVLLVNARTSSMFFGSTFPDAPPVFWTGPKLLAEWGKGPRKILFVPIEARDEYIALLGRYQIILAETSGKLLVTDRPLDPGLAERKLQ